MGLGQKPILRGAIAWCVLANVIGAVPSIRAQATKLDEFVGKDLWKHPLPPRLEASLGKTLGTDLAVWHIWKTTSNATMRYAALFRNQVGMIPGADSACIFLVDGALKRFGNWCFETGRRISLQSASFEYSTILDSDVVVLHMGHGITGGPWAKEYFALSDDRLQLVRLENDKGEAIQNDYAPPNFEIGIIPSAKTETDWVGLLQSARKADVLSALVFLDGRHSGSSRYSKYDELFRQLIDAPRIRALITRLVKSNDKWIRQAAVLAAREPDKREDRYPRPASTRPP